VKDQLFAIQLFAILIFDERYRATRVVREAFRMPALKQKIIDAMRGSRSSLSLEMNPAHAEGTPLSKGSSGTGDDCTGLRNTVWTFGSVWNETTWRIRRTEDLGSRTGQHEPPIGEPFRWLYYKWVREKHSKFEQSIAIRYKNTLLNKFCSSICSQGRL
jgi:hypothetical protein